MNLKTAIAAAVLALASVAQANVDPRWITVDFTGDGRPEAVATSNLADIVFNEYGEAIFWHIKDMAGRDYIRVRGEGENRLYDFTRLQRQANLLGENGRGFVVRGPGLQGPRQAAPMELAEQLQDNNLIGTFRYRQGDTLIEKRLTVDTRQFNVFTDLNVQGTGPYQLTFTGLNRVESPLLKNAGRGAQITTGPGTVRDVLYAGMQEPTTMWNSQRAGALFVHPLGDTRAGATLVGGGSARLAGLAVTLPEGQSRLQVYGGKNELIHLSQAGLYQFPGVFEPNIWGQMSLQLARLMEWLYSLLGHWGLVLLAITLMVRLAIWPIMQSQGRMSAKMQLVAPEIERIREKHKDDQQKIAAETMRVYQEHKLNPAGCFTGFLTLPVLMVMWLTIRNFEFDTGFLWMNDLAIPDPLFILPVLYFVSNIALLWVTMSRNRTMFRQQAFLYVFFVYFAIMFPAGVTIYWIMSTLIGIVQQLLINKQVEREFGDRLTQVQKTAPAGAGGIMGGGFLQRLRDQQEEMQRQAQAGQGASPRGGRKVVDADKDR